MLKKAFILLIVLSSVLVALSIVKIEDKEVFTNKIIIAKKILITKTKEKPIGYIQIPTIKIKRPLYDIESDQNNIEENITILKESEYPDKENSILFIAAHSGTSEIAFFNRLDELQIQDEIIISILNKTYYYEVKDIYEQYKDGYIRGHKENKKQLVLTTCCPNKDNCQLIINCIEKES